jgi:ABC-type polysaccharide/polyol phosphate transport system ATPase subunit
MSAPQAVPSGTVGVVSAVKPGEIRIDDVSRRFRVYPKPARTLKEVILARGRMRPTEVWALSGVTIHADSGEAVGLVGRNGSGKTTLLKLISQIIKPTAGRVAVGGRVGSLLELGAGFHPDFTGRENVFLNGAIHGLKRSTIREHMEEIVAFAGLERFIDLPVRTYSSGMYMRLGFAIAAHLDADVLLLDEVFAVGDEEFQRKCFGKISQFKQGGGTIVFVSHDAAAVERLCERAVLLRQGMVEFDGSTREALVRYRGLLAEERDPAERQAGLREWGSGEARIVEATLHGADGEQRLQFVAGEPMTVRLRVVAGASLPPPQLQFELRDDSGILLAGGTQETAELGWSTGPGERVFRFEVDELPLADGRFHLRFGLVSPDGGHLYHWLDDALRLFVIPRGGSGGLVHLEGRWVREEIEAAAEIPGR